MILGATMLGTVSPLAVWGQREKPQQLCEQKEFNRKNCELGKSRQGNQKDRKATEEHHRGRNSRAQGQKENA